MKKKILLDIFLNILATMIPMFALQFIVLPMVSLRLDNNAYGQLIAIIALINFSGASIGNVINNSKLINNSIYKKFNLKGDYNLLFVFGVILNFAIMFVGILFYAPNYNLFTSVEIILISTLLLANGYISVDFRIKLNFNNILLSGMFMFIGYLIGYAIFLVTNSWPVIYLTSYGSVFLFGLFKTDILKEPYKKTKFFYKTLSQTAYLLGSGLLVSLGAYVDKLLIYPLLGGTAVSVYYVSTILGKTISLVMGPVTGVLLSYLAQMKEFSSRNFKVAIIISMVVGCVGYVFIVLISEPLLKIIYPQYVDEALRYVKINTVSIIISIASNLINSVILKFYDARWQVIINSIYMLIYIVSSILLLKSYGLVGFCIGILFANITKLALLINVYFSKKARSFGARNA